MALKILIFLIVLSIAAIPFTAVLSAAAQQIKVSPSPLDSPAIVDSNGIITKTGTIFVSNYGFFDINSILLVTNVLNESLSPYGLPTINLGYVPHGSMIPFFIVTRVNLTALNQSGTIGNFLNSSYTLCQNILDVRYGFSLVGFSTMLIYPMGALSPMSDIKNLGPAVRDSSDPTKANVTFYFLNYAQGYNFHIEATLSKGLVSATGSGDYSASSAIFSLPSPVVCSITVTSIASIPVESGYTLTLTVTSPFGYTYTNNNVEVVG